VPEFRRHLASLWFLQLAIAHAATSMNATGSSLRGSQAAIPKCSDGRYCPHLVTVIGDDMGYHTVPWHSKPMKEYAPTLAMLAQEGVVLDRHYAFYVCSPTRASFLTGRAPYKVYQGTIQTCSKTCLPSTMTLLPEKLRGAGYATHAVGKWHLGHAEASCLPESRGFDSYFGYLSGGPDCWTQLDGTLVDLWSNRGPAVGKNGTDYLDNLLGEQAAQIVQSHPAQSPLFLYFGSRSAHVTDGQFQHPEMAELIDGMPANWTEARRNYTAMIRNLDQHLSTITSALKARDMWRHTLLLFFSDNGAPEDDLGLPNAPLLGAKATPFEGGVRTAALVSGGRVPPGRRGQRHEGNSR